MKDKKNFSLQYDIESYKLSFKSLIEDFGMAFCFEIDRSCNDSKINQENFSLQIDIKKFNSVNEIGLESLYRKIKSSNHY